MIQESNTIIADKGMTFKRIIDGVIIGNRIQLDKDYSTGVERDDLPQYYEEIVDENYVEEEVKAEENKVEKGKKPLKKVIWSRLINHEI